jgi:hypothetical protein
VTTSLREAITSGMMRPKPAQQPEPEVASGITFDFEKEPDKLNALVSDAMKDVQEEIDLQSLVNDAMAEFQGIHQEMERQRARTSGGKTASAGERTTATRRTDTTEAG